MSTEEKILYNLVPAGAIFLPVPSSPVSLLWLAVAVGAGLDGFEKVVVGLALILEGEPAVGDVVQVLEPLKVGHGHTPRIDVHVGDDQHSLVLYNNH